MIATVKGTLTSSLAAAALLALAACTTAPAPAPPTASPAATGETVPGAHCGIERWAVKTGTDPLAGQVDITSPTDTSVGALAALPIPAGWSQDAGRLAGSAEMTDWRVHATLVKYKQEADSDYHLVIAADGMTMIAEIPEPACVGSSSPFKAGITAARTAFDAKYHPSPVAWQAAGVPVVITGPGFFDALHGQTGVAPNGIEIHPVLDIQFAQ